MAMVLDETTLERIQRRQAEIRPLRTALLLVASLLFGVGWLVFHVWAFVWSAFTWSAAAAVEGWSAAKAARAAGAG